MSDYFEMSEDFSRALAEYRRQRAQERRERVGQVVFLFVYAGIVIAAAAVFGWLGER